MGNRRIALSLAIAMQLPAWSAARAQDQSADSATTSDKGRFFVHAGPGGVYFNTKAKVHVTATGTSVAGLDGKIDDDYSLLVEAGYMIRDNISVSLTVGIPPNAGLKASGPVGNAIGNPVVGTARYGPAVLAAQYHLPRIGPFRPYIGGGPVYLIIFHNRDGVLTDFTAHSRFGGALQGGVDIALTRKWGLFLDVKKLWVSTRVTTSGGALPASTAMIRLDPIAAHAGVSFKF